MFQDKPATYENITGFLQINNTSGDFFKTTWYFQIVDPSGTIERSWKVTGDELFRTIQNELDFSHSVLKTGYYQIRFLNYGPCDFNIYIESIPYAWNYVKYGTSDPSWKVTK
jgi:hypothetical protein